MAVALHYVLLETLTSEKSFSNRQMRLVSCTTVDFAVETREISMFRKEGPTQRFHGIAVENIQHEEHLCDLNDYFYFFVEVERRILVSNARRLYHRMNSTMSGFKFAKKVGGSKFERTILVLWNPCRMNS